MEWILCNPLSSNEKVFDNTIIFQVINIDQNFYDWLLNNETEHVKISDD